MIAVDDISYDYKTRRALHRVSFQVNHREIFGVLGPNGSGKSTLFRILSTFFRPREGRVLVEGRDLFEDLTMIRRKIGVVFQSPALDGKLTVTENLRHQGHLYGLRGQVLKKRIHELLAKFGLRDRSHDRVDKLSGGLQRRVELAKAFLHKPMILILDEPSTGLDPGARLEMWSFLEELCQNDGVTILLTTHWMEEAERASRIVILKEGEVVVMGKPDELKRQLGGDVLLVQAKDPVRLLTEIQDRFKLPCTLAEGYLQIEHPGGPQFLTQLIENFPGWIESVTYRKPTLEDVFIHYTGQSFWAETTSTRK